MPYVSADTAARRRRTTRRRRAASADTAAREAAAKKASAAPKPKAKPKPKPKPKVSADTAARAVYRPKSPSIWDRFQEFFRSFSAISQFSRPAVPKAAKPAISTAASKAAWVQPHRSTEDKKPFRPFQGPLQPAYTVEDYIENVTRGFRGADVAGSAPHLTDAQRIARLGYSKWSEEAVVDAAWVIATTGRYPATPAEAKAIKERQVRKYDALTRAADPKYNPMVEFDEDVVQEDGRISFEIGRHASRMLAKWYYDNPAPIREEATGFWAKVGVGLKYAWYRTRRQAKESSAALQYFIDWRDKETEAPFRAGTTVGTMLDFNTDYGTDKGFGRGGEFGWDAEEHEKAQARKFLGSYKDFTAEVDRFEAETGRFRSREGSTLFGPGGVFGKIEYAWLRSLGRVESEEDFRRMWAYAYYNDVNPMSYGLDAPGDSLHKFGRAAAEFGYTWVASPWNALDFVTDPLFDKAFDLPTVIRRVQAQDDWAVAWKEAVAARRLADESSSVALRLLGSASSHLAQYTRGRRQYYELLHATSRSAALAARFAGQLDEAHAAAARGESVASHLGIFENLVNLSEVPQRIPHTPEEWEHFKLDLQGKRNIVDTIARDKNVKKERKARRVMRRLDDEARLRVAMFILGPEEVAARLKHVPFPVPDEKAIVDYLTKRFGGDVADRVMTWVNDFHVPQSKAHKSKFVASQYKLINLGTELLKAKIWTWVEFKRYLSSVADFDKVPDGVVPTWRQRKLYRGKKVTPLADDWSDKYFPLFDPLAEEFRAQTVPNLTNVATYPFQRHAEGMSYERALETIGTKEGFDAALDYRFRGQLQYTARCELAMHYMTELKRLGSQAAYDKRVRPQFLRDMAQTSAGLHKAPGPLRRFMRKWFGINNGSPERMQAFNDLNRALVDPGLSPDDRQKLVDKTLEFVRHQLDSYALTRAEIARAKDILERAIGLDQVDGVALVSRARSRGLVDFSDAPVHLRVTADDLPRIRSQGVVWNAAQWGGLGTLGNGVYYDRAVAERVSHLLDEMSLRPEDPGRVPGHPLYEETKAAVLADPDYAPVILTRFPDAPHNAASGISVLDLAQWDPEEGVWRALKGDLGAPDPEAVIHRGAEAYQEMLDDSRRVTDELLSTETEVSVAFGAALADQLAGHGIELGDRLADRIRNLTTMSKSFDAALGSCDKAVKAAVHADEAADFEMLADLFRESVEHDALHPDEYLELARLSGRVGLDTLDAGLASLNEAYARMSGSAEVLLRELSDAANLDYSSDMGLADGFATPIWDDDASEWLASLGQTPEGQKYLDSAVADAASYATRRSAMSAEQAASLAASLDDVRRAVNFVLETFPEMTGVEFRRGFDVDTIHPEGLAGPDNAAARRPRDVAETLFAVQADPGDVASVVLGPRFSSTYGTNPIIGRMEAAWGLKPGHDLSVGQIEAFITGHEYGHHLFHIRDDVRFGVDYDPFMLSRQGWRDILFGADPAARREIANARDLDGNFLFPEGRIPLDREERGLIIGHSMTPGGAISQFGPSGSGQLTQDQVVFLRNLAYRYQPDERFADEFAGEMVSRLRTGGEVNGLPTLREWTIERLGVRTDLDSPYYLELMSGRAVEWDELAAKLRAVRDMADKRMEVLERIRFVKVIRSLQERYLASLDQADGAALRTAERILFETGGAAPEGWLALTPMDFYARLRPAMTREVMAAVAEAGPVPDGVEPLEVMLSIFGDAIVGRKEGLPFELQLFGAQHAVAGLGEYKTPTFESLRRAMGEVFSDIADTGAGRAFVERGAAARRLVRESQAGSIAFQNAFDGVLSKDYGMDVVDFFESHQQRVRAVGEAVDADLAAEVARMRHAALTEADRLVQSAAEDMVEFAREFYRLAGGAYSPAYDDLVGGVQAQPMKRYRGVLGQAYRPMKKILEGLDKTMSVYRALILSSVGFLVGNAVDIVVKNLFSGATIKSIMEGQVALLKAFYKRGVYNKFAWASEAIGIGNIHPVDDSVVRQLMEGDLLLDPAGKRLVPMSGTASNYILPTGDVPQTTWDRFVNWIFSTTDDLEMAGRQVIFSDTWDRVMRERLSDILPGDVIEIDELFKMPKHRRQGWLRERPELKGRLDEVWEEVSDSGFQSALQKTMFTHFDYENISPLQQLLKRFFMFPLYATKNTQYWATMFALRPQWFRRLYHAQENEDLMQPEVKVGGETYRLDLRYLMSTNKYSSRGFGGFDSMEGGLSFIGLDFVPMLGKTLQHLGFIESQNYRDGMPLLNMLARGTALSPFLRGEGTGVDIPRFADYLFSAFLDKAALPGAELMAESAGLNDPATQDWHIADTSSWEAYNEYFHRMSIRAAANRAIPGNFELPMADAEREVATRELLMDAVAFFFKAYPKYRPEYAWMNKDWPLSDWERWRKGEFYRSFQEDPDVVVPRERTERETEFAVREILAEWAQTADNNIAGFRSEARRAARAKYDAALAEFERQNPGLYTPSGFASLEAIVLAQDRAERSAVITAYFELSAKWRARLEEGPQAGDARKKLKEQRDRELGSMEEDHYWLKDALAAMGDERVQRFKGYEKAGFEKLVQEYLAASDIKSWSRRREVQDRIEAASAALARRYRSGLAAEGYPLLEDEFPTIREFFYEHSTPLEKRVTDFYKARYPSYAAWRKAFLALPADVRAVVEENHGGPYKLGRGGGGGLAKWRAAYPNLARLFDLRAGSFDQWWAAYLALPVREQEKLNYYRRRAKKAPFPVGPDAKQIDWGAWTRRYGVGLAKEFPGLARLFDTEFPSFEQWWQAYLALKPREQRKLNALRIAKGKPAFPEGEAARKVDWDTFADQFGSKKKRTGTFFGVAWEVLDGYFDIPAAQRTARHVYITEHPELQVAFDRQKEFKREERRLGMEKFLSEHPAVAAQVAESHKEFSSHTAMSAPRVADVSVSGSGAKPKRRKRKARRT